MVLYVLPHIVEMSHACVFDGAICVATYCRDVTCPVYLMVLYMLPHIVEMSHACV